MSTPNGPNGTKTVRVSQANHTRLMDLAERLGGSADDALAFLLGASTVRVPVSDIQRQRWSEAAAMNGVSLSEFVRMRVEAALQYGADPGGLLQIYELLRGVAQVAGAQPLPVPRPQQAPRPSTPRTPQGDQP